MKKLKILPRWVIICMDVSIITFCCLFAYLLRFNFQLSEIYEQNVMAGVGIYAGLGFFSVFITRSYKGIIRYTGLEDSVQILYATALNLFLVTIFNHIYSFYSGKYLLPYSVILICFLASFLFLFNYRLLIKSVFSYYKTSVLDRKNVVVFGAGQSGVIAKLVIEANPQFKVVGFCDDDSNKIGKVLNGVTIFSGLDHLEKILKRLNANELIIAIQNLSQERKNAIVDECLKKRVKVRVVPPVRKWVRGELSLKQIKEVNIDELLGRAAIRLNNQLVMNELESKIICITGAAGSIGGELVRQIASYRPCRLLLIDQSESALFEIEQELLSQRVEFELDVVIGDVFDSVRMEDVFSRFRPDIVFHAAAYKHVPLMEGNPYEAVRTNVLGTKQIADLAVKFKVKKFVMISTDKAVNPTNVMGCSKRIAEIYVQSLNEHIKLSNGCTSFVTTRFGNVLGSNGSVIPFFKKQIESGGPVTVTHPEITRYFMTIPEACELVLEAATMSKGGEIFIFDMGQAIRIYDLARKMIMLSELELGRDIEIVFTGLREGEKLYEELLNSKENALPTHHDKIMIARVRVYAYSTIQSELERLKYLLGDPDDLQLVAWMKTIVPEFKSNYSRFETLDVNHSQ